MAATSSHWCINKLGNYDRRQVHNCKCVRQLEQRMAKVKMGLSSMATKLELIAFDDLWPTAQMQLVLKSPLSHLVSDSQFV